MGAIAMATLALNYSFISNPDSRFGGANHTTASKINNNGEVAGFYTHEDDGSIRGFYLENGSYVDIVRPGVDATEAFGLNDNGDLVGMTFTGGPPSGAFLFSGGSFSDVVIPGAGLVAAQDVNNSGQIVGVFSDGGPGNHGFILDGGVLTQLDAPDAEQTIAFGINSLGHVVGTFQTADESHGFVYDGTDFFELDVPGAALTFVQDINDWGQITGFYIDNNSNAHGFVFAEGNFYDIAVPGNTGAIPGSIQVTGINNLGQVVGTYLTDGGFGQEGFTATLGMEFTYDVTFFDHPDAVPSAGPPAAFGTEIRNSNVDGDFVGRYSDSSGPGFTGQSFASIGGTVFDLEFIDATGGMAATDINDLGQIVGTYRVAEDGSLHGFIYDGGTYQTLDIDNPFASDTDLLGMNNIGRIVGTYTDVDGEHAFYYDPVAGFADLDLDETGAVGNDIIALDVNDHGQIVGTYVDILTGIRHGFFLNDGELTTVAHPDAAPAGFGSGGVSINNAGQIAGFYMDASFAVHAFVLSGGVYSTIDMPNPGGAYGISNNGVVSGSDNDGTTHHGFMAEISGGTLVPTLVPPPAVVAWAKGVDGDFDDPTKWGGGALPGENDRAVINRPGEFTVTMTSFQAVDTLVVGSLDNDGATLHVVGATLQVNGGKVIVPGTLVIDATALDGAELVLVSDTNIVGGCGCEPDIQMGTASSPFDAKIISDGDAMKLVNAAWIAGRGQIGDEDMRLVNVGVIEANGGLLTLDTGANLIVNAGFLEAGPDSTLEVNSAINNFGDITAIGAASGGEINLNDIVKNFGLITVEEGASIDVTGDLKNFGGIDVDGSFTATGSVLNEVLSGVTANGNGVVDITGNVVNRGFFAAFDDAEIQLGSVNNVAGTLTADGGSIIVGTTTGAAGEANIIDDGSIQFGLVSRANVDFSGDEGGALILEDASTFKGSVAGFDDTDMIQFKDLLFGSDVDFKYDEALGLLKIFENGVLDSKLSFVGAYTDADFEIVDDGTGHVAIQHFEII
jgi:probable HAF family extracellular repeat protein